MSDTTTTGRVSAFGDDALGDLDSVGLAALVAAGGLSTSELLEAAIARTEQVDGALNAVAVWDLERARAKAGSVEPTGVLGGVPTFWKGITNVAGLPNRMGSRAVPDTPVADSSPTIVQLESTGLVSLGLTTTPEFGLTASTEPALTGPTRNPWSLDHSPGGSSGGAAALVACGAVPIAHANDGGGSIRIPAACCGLVGLKPSRGRILAEPLPKVLPIDFTAEGVVSRTVRDTAAFMFGAEQHHPAPNLPHVGHVTRPDSRRLRIGVLDHRLDGAGYDSVCTAELLRVAAGLEELGHRVDVIANPFPTHLIDDFLMLWAMVPTLLWYGGSRVLGPGWDRDELEPFTRWLISHFRRHAASTPGAFRRLRRYVQQYSEAYRHHEVLLAPTLGAPVHRLGYLSPELPGEVHMTRVRHMVPTTPIHNAGGGPAISLPLATDADGLPLGMHLSADVGQEATLLGLAFELEGAMPWPTLATAGA